MRAEERRDEYRDYGKATQYLKDVCLKVADDPNKDSVEHLQCAISRYWSALEEKCWQELLQQEGNA